jgi:hypothetical protein
MVVINLLPKDEVSPVEEKHQIIDVPEVDHEEAQDASDLVDFIKEKYNIADEDLDLLYNAFVCVFLRGKQLSKN